jgi:hypothetical protein
MATCHLCGGIHIPDRDLIDHLRILHPDHYGEIERWPDGDVVIYDTTTEPYEWEKP